MDGSALHPSLARVRAALAAAGCEAEVRQLDESTRTAPEAAAALGVAVAQIAKTLVFLVDGEPTVAVVGGADRVDPARLAAAAGGRRATRADADAVRAATGYPIGGVSPAGLPAGLTVLVDPGLSAHDEVWAAAGTPRAVYRSSFAELLTVSGGRAADVAAR